METLKDFLNQNVPDIDENLIITNDTSISEIIVQILEWESPQEIATILLTTAKTNFDTLAKINRYHSFDISEQFDIMNNEPVTNLIKPCLNGEYVKFEDIKELLEQFETVFKLAKLAKLGD